MVHTADHLCYFIFLFILPLSPYHQSHPKNKVKSQRDKRRWIFKKSRNDSGLCEVSCWSIRRNVLLKSVKLCLETPGLYPSEGYKYDDRKLTRTYAIEFCNKNLVVVFFFHLFFFFLFSILIFLACLATWSVYGKESLSPRACRTPFKLWQKERAVFCFSLVFLPINPRDKQIGTCIDRKLGRDIL